MTQDAVNHIGAAVDSLIVEFDQAAYEAYLRGPASPKKAMHAYKNTHALRVSSATDTLHSANVRTCN